MKQNRVETARRTASGSPASSLGRQQAPVESLPLSLPELKRPGASSSSTEKLPDAGNQFSRIESQLPSLRLAKKKGNGKESSVCAVSLAYLVKFGSKVPRDWTTEDVFNCLVQQRTEPGRCRYVDIIPPKHVNKPDFYVVHRWGNVFHHTLGLIENQISKVHPSPRTHEWIFIWIDVFCANQHVQQEDYLKQCSLAIQNAQATLFCVDLDLKIFRRIWCLYEVYLTMINKGNMLVLSRNTDWFELEKAIAALDFDSAECTIEEHKAHMRTEIKRAYGSYASFDQLVRQELQRSTPKSMVNASKTGQKQLEYMKWVAEQQAQKAKTQYGS